MSSKKKKVVRVLRGVLWGALIICILLCVYMVACRILGKPAFVGRYTVMRIVSPSMEPVIPTGECILCEKVSLKDLAVGDIISFYSDDPALNGSLNTHRIVDIRPDGSIITRGDNNAGVDQYPVKPENVVARYKKNIRWLSDFLGFLSTKAGYVVLILIPGILLLVWAFQDVIAGAWHLVLGKTEEKKEEEQKTEKK